MKNKKIQEERVKGYFIQATKDILKGEGLNGISVRNVADKAGYSYATLYNYFKDINDLIFICVNDFQEECKEFVNSQTKGDTAGIEKLKATIIAYLKYFTEYPGIFDLFYLAKGGDFCNKQTIIEVINKSLDNVCADEWNFCLKHKVFKVENVEQLKAQLRYSVIGLLSLYLNRLSPKTYSEFINEANMLIDFQLGIKSGVTNTSKTEISKVQNSLISVNVG